MLLCVRSPLTSRRILLYAHPMCHPQHFTLSLTVWQYLLLLVSIRLILSIRLSSTRILLPTSAP